MRLDIRCWWRAAGVAILTATTVLAGPFDAWTYRAKVTFAGYTRGETLTNFPALVVLGTNIADFQYSAFKSGTNADLRFADSNGATPLNYEIDTWNTNGASFVWVQVPRLTTTNDFIYAYWGVDGQTAPDCTTNGATWTNGYVAVWHLGETTTPCHDSAGADNFVTNLNIAGTVSTNMALCAGGWVFPGSASAGLSGPNHAELGGLTNMTLEGWGLDTGAGDGIARGFMGKRTGASSSESFIFYNQTKNVNFRVGPTASSASSGSLITTGAWHYAAATFEPALATLERNIYVDGQLNTSASDTQANVPTYTAPINLGTLNLGYTSSWKGTLDELRISSVVRSSNWLWACWLNAGSNALFNTYGAAIAQDQTPPRIAVLPATNVTQTTAWLNADLQSTGTSATAVWVYWGTNSGGNDAAAWAATNAFGNNTAGPMSYAYQATSLTPSLSYVYRYRAQNASGDVWTADQPFTTLIPPAVDIAGGATNVLNTSARLQGRVTAGTPAPQVFVYWDTDGGGPDPIEWEHEEDLGTQTGLFGTNVSGLATQTVYYYRCFVTNSEGGAWSDGTSFVTKAWTHVFTNSGNWSVAGNWSPPGPPSNATQVGGIPAGLVATANADLGSAGDRPTIQIEAGGRVNQTADISVPIVLNGGVFKADGYVNTTGPFALLSASAIEKTAHCCNGKSLSGNISGAGKLTFRYLNQYDNDYTISGSNTFSGGADFLAGPTHTGLVYCGVNALSTNGPPGAPNVVRVSTNFRMCLNGSITRDLTLDGGTLSSWNNTPIVTGTLTLTAPSRLMTAGWVGGGMSLQGPITGAYAVTMEPTYGDLTLKTASPDWTGGLHALGATYKTVIQVAGAQGAGPLRVASGSTLAFDGTVSQDWSITNPVLGRGTLKVEDGAGNNRLTLRGTSVAPGDTTGAAGKLTVDGKQAFTNQNAAYCTLTLDIAGTNGVAGTDFDQLVVDHGDAVFAGSLTNCDLTVAVAPTFAQLTGQTLTVLAATNTDFTGQGFRSVTWAGDAGELLYLNGSVRILFSTGATAPAVDNDGGATNLRPSRALLRGQVTQGSPPPTAYVCYGLTDGGTGGTGDWEHAISMDVQSGTFSTNVTGLFPGTLYAYRCFATNSAGGAWADATNFTTPSELVFTFTNHNANWDLASSWSPAGGPPLAAAESGVVPAGKTAKANADLGTAGDRPTVRVDAGGQVEQTADNATPLALNGGVLTIGGFMDNHSPISMLAPSAITSLVQCCNGKGMDGTISGTGKVTFVRSGGAGREWYFTGSNTFSGGIELGASSGTPEILIRRFSLGVQGPPEAPNTVTISPYARVRLDGYGSGGGFMLARDVTMNGGSLEGDHYNGGVTGIIAMAADSTFGTYGWTGGGTLTLGPLTGSGRASVWAAWYAVKFAYPAVEWSGGVDALYGTCQFMASGAQGSGALNVRSNAMLAFDATADQDWFVTNHLASINGHTNATVTVEAGAATTRTLTLCGRTLAPGGTNDIGVLTVNGRLALAAAGAQSATLALEANGTNVFTGANGANSYDQLRVNGGLVNPGGQLLQVRLGAGYTPLPTDTLDILLNGGTSLVAGTFAEAGEGGRVNCLRPDGKWYVARITYVANADGGTVANDVRLHSFVRGGAGSLFTIY